MASMLKSVDDSLGRIMDRLDELELTDNTLFIFYSDNGGNVHSTNQEDKKLANLKPNHPRYAFVQDWRKWARFEGPTNNAPLREGKGRIYEGGSRVPLMVRWPGRIKPGTTSDAIIGPIDIYPTVLEALGVEMPAGHIVDGESFMPVLKQTGTMKREALFTWFPHLIPAVSVRQGDWKLIRRFEPHPKYPEIRELYNLRTDIGETINHAAKMPERVRQLDALIDDFIKETGARAPIPNPAHRKNAASNVINRRARGGLTAGLVPKMSRIALVAGAIRVEADGRTPFLGTGQIRYGGEMTLNLRVRSAAGGEGMVRWKGADQDEFPEGSQQVSFPVAAGDDWQDVTVQLPVKDRTAIVRLYLPAAASPVEVQSIRYTGSGGAQRGQLIHQWDFTRATP